MGATLELTTWADGVAEIVLSRPELLNRFDRELHHDLTETLRALRADESVRAIVLASTGSAFSAGGDFALMRAANEDAAVRRTIIDDAGALLDAFLAVPQPIIAAVQGPAIGLGATVVLACDAVVAVRSATLADTHVAIGLVAGDGGCLVWPASAGMLRARRHLLTGDPLTAETAFQLGLVTDLVDEADQVRAEALKLALRIAQLAPLAVQGTKRVLNQLSRQRAGEVVDLALSYEEMTLGSADLREGVEAFTERRKPKFTGA
ncbi:enoyl-CoA hydratase/isomerase family protein [Nocardia sp. ET3-3]|uniref:Enoyl-CoA hydratase/isomerase family protein n=1 Tax=Nocardia terrae TaxID=2675851 RepID=A0A7K1V3S7_9NOCA|nr:enoyl-CoA hydratase-related protein [Nocardia terrae]MVU80798.1 enoyl-CoA hydratase/isomerase family protein [Nocardia terrae]